MSKSLRFEISTNPYYEKSDKQERRQINQNLRRFTKSELKKAQKRLEAISDRGTDEEYYQNQVAEYEFWKMRRRCP